MSESAISRALSRVIDPELRLPITELDMVEIHETSEAIRVKVLLTVAGCPAAQKIESDVRAAVAEFGASVEMGVMDAEQRKALTAKLRGNRPAKYNPFGVDTLTRVFLIGSGKGGVGKSSVTANLAVALSKAGHRVGLIDADIFGFSIPGQLGIDGKPTRVDSLILPPVAHGIKVISIGMFLEGNQPVAWRGPMLHRAVEQFLTDVYWGDLDFLLVDLPPGTGDIAISLGQLLPTAKSIVITTPQVAAADVAERSGSVGLQTGQPIFGVIENMAWFEQPDGSRLEIFGSGGGQLVAERLSAASDSPVSVLGQIPISVKLREGSDLGLPVVAENPDDKAAQSIIEIAKKVASDQIGLAGKKLGINLK